MNHVYVLLSSSVENDKSKQQDKASWI
jgi:hypothetical protein